MIYQEQYLLQVLREYDLTLIEYHMECNSVIKIGIRDAVYNPINNYLYTDFDHHKNLDKNVKLSNITVYNDINLLSIISYLVVMYIDAKV